MAPGEVYFLDKTLIMYTLEHPALGGCFGAGCLVSYGRNLVADGNTSGDSPQVPESDLLDCNGHGTHVAGIIAAQKNKFGFTGAAPEVTLGAYKIFGCDGVTSNDILIAAFNQAYEDGSDIITASIGGSSGWSEEPSAVAVQRIVEAGVPCTIAAGNDGGAGIFYASTPANGKRATAIASVENTERPRILLEASYTTGNSSAISFGWVTGDPSSWGNISLPLWAVQYNTSEPSNECGSFPTDTPDLSQHIVLIWIEGCYLDQQVEYVAAHGARFVMFYSKTPEMGVIAISVPGIEALGMVTPEQGAVWISLLSRNISVAANIVDPKSAVTFLSRGTNIETGGFVSTYTSWGPTFEMDLKPQFAAPGGWILSTYPLNQGGYAVLSGTSMACPLVAAIYALVGQVRGTLDPATIENLLSATANPNLFHDGKKAFPYLAPTAQQGGGLVQAYDAAHSTTILSVSSLAFNDTDHLVASAKFTIKNLGTNDVTYTLSNIGAATAYSLNADSVTPHWFPNELTAEGASLSFSSDKITIPGGSEAVVAVAPIAPALDASRLPVYSGYITLNATNGESFSLPYLGLLGSLNKARVLGNNTFFSDLTNHNPILANQTFMFPKNGSIDFSYNYPAFQALLALGTKVLRVDAIPLDPAVNTTDVAGVQIIGSIDSFPVTWMSRDGYVYAWTGRLEDGTFVPAGGYKLLIRALRIFGDVSKADDYDSVESVPFVISYTSS